MNSERLNEHDSQQGAESKGEFFGMTGNSAWYLLGSSGASLLLVVVLWGILGFSLLLCLLFGFVLCGLSVAYVFTLKNNRPQHYDTDYFEVALVEAGLILMAFGPRAKRPRNPFRTQEMPEDRAEPQHYEQRMLKSSQRSASATIRADARRAALNSAPAVDRRSRSNSKADEEIVTTVPLAAFERLQNELNDTTAMLEDALADREEERV